MSRYIDADLIGDRVSHGLVDYEVIKAIPTADVVEVVRGEMNDLIRRQDAIDLVEELELKYLRGEIELMYTHTIKGLMSLSSAQPSADVAPVVHGEWIAEEIHNCWTEFECSVCKFKHKSVCNFGKPMTEFNYCPHCGAKMDEKI